MLAYRFVELALRKFPSPIRRREISEGAHRRRWRHHSEISPILLPPAAKRAAASPHHRHGREEWRSIAPAICARQFARAHHATHGKELQSLMKIKLEENPSRVWDIIRDHRARYRSRSGPRSRSVGFSPRRFYLLPQGRRRQREFMPARARCRGARPIAESSSFT